MNLFDKLVDEAISSSSTPQHLRLVVEKELLHHDILRELSKAGLLKGLTFMGGTCLRACYGATRLSEDLDFTGGKDFNKEDLRNLSQTIIQRFKKKYDLPVQVTEPYRECGNTQTWKIKVITRPERSDLPSQKINIDICSVPSYQKQPRTLMNHYPVDMGTDGLILQCESLDEILLDKIVAFALRPNRIKNRDLWDIAWLQQQGHKLPLELAMSKIADHNQEQKIFIEKLEQRISELSESNQQKKYFTKEMERFLPLNVVEKTIYQDGFWPYIVSQTVTASSSVIKILENGTLPDAGFPMS